LQNDLVKYLAISFEINNDEGDPQDMFLLLAFVQLKE